MSDHQLQTLRTYQRLIDLRSDWPGALILTHGAASAEAGIPPAASIAGAASLLLSDAAPEVKQAYRRGEIDFVVNSLSEAIRALKNEVRQQRPLSVTLIGDVDAITKEMHERGLQPDATITPGDINIHSRRICEYFLPANTSSALREVDARLLALLPADDTPRRRWLQGVSRYMRSESTGRWLHLTEEEAATLTAEGLNPQQP